MFDTHQKSAPLVRGLDAIACGISRDGDVIAFDLAAGAPPFLVDEAPKPVFVRVRSRVFHLEIKNKM